ncbi:MAG: hypothetical protein OHK0012_15650 [Synechococcales cyanobacterium]
MGWWVVLTGWPTVAQAQSSQSSLLSGRVEAVLGGDNVLININGQSVNVDLAHISPPYGGSNNWDQLAASRLAEILPPGTPVLVDPAWQMGSVTYGYVYGPEGLVNVQLLREGLSAPRGLPQGETMRQWYNQALESAQNTGINYWQAEVATLGMASSWSVPMPSARVGAIGLGGVAVCLTMMAGWKWWQHPRRHWQRHKQSLQKQLPNVLMQQKRLEKNYQKLINQMQDCVTQAEVAIQAGYDDQARAALIQKRQYAAEAQQLEQQLQAISGQVVTLRREIDTLDQRLGSRTALAE